MCMYMYMCVCVLWRASSRVKSGDFFTFFFLSPTFDPNVTAHSHIHTYIHTYVQQLHQFMRCNTTRVVFELRQKKTKSKNAGDIRKNQSSTLIRHPNNI